MSLLEMDKDDVVMEYGDIGYNFYLTLEGEVEITVPDPNHKKAFLQLKKDIEGAIEDRKLNQISLERVINKKKKLELQKQLKDEKMAETVFEIKSTHTSKFLENDIPTIIQRHET